MVNTALISLVHCREFACGNNLDRGLQKCFLNAADFRTNCLANDTIPPQYFGNAVGATFVMPPDVASLSLSPHSSAAGSSISDTAHKQEVQPQVLSAEKCGVILAAAACAIRQSVQAFRTDPDSLQMQAASHMQQREQSVKAWLASPGFMPVRDAALFVSSWRNMAVDEVDFGAGKASLHLGSLVPACQRVADVCAGNGDGLMCILRLPKEGLNRVQESQLLKHVAPGAVLLV